MSLNFTILRWPAGFSTWMEICFLEGTSTSVEYSHYLMLMEVMSLNLKPTVSTSTAASNYQWQILKHQFWIANWDMLLCEVFWNHGYWVCANQWYYQELWCLFMPNLVPRKTWGKGYSLRDNQKLSVFIQVSQDHWKFPKTNTCCVIINAYVY